MALIQEHRSPALDEVEVMFILVGEFKNMLEFVGGLTREERHAAAAKTVVQ